MSETSIVSCPACRQPARIPAEALGLTVECPHCRHQYEAGLAPGPSLRTTVIPIVYRHPKYDRRPAANDDGATTEGGGLLIALAMLPIGLPLLWLILTLVAAPSAFSFAAPVAIAFGAGCLGFGLAFVARWSIAVRASAILFVAALATAFALACYFTPKPWLEVLRQFAAFNGGLAWKEYVPDDRSFKVRVPNGRANDDELLPDWKGTAKKFVHRRKPVDAFIVAQSETPAALRRKSDEDWFEAVLEQLQKTHPGEVNDVREIGSGEGTVREFSIARDASNLACAVRILRTKTRTYVLLVEGPFLVQDRPDVDQFFRSFQLTPSN